MKIFITIPWFLPAFKAGGPIQSIASLLENFTEAEYGIFCGDTDLGGETLKNVEKNKWLVYNDRTEVFYSSKENRSKALTQETEKQQPDILFIIGLFSWHFNIVPLFFCKAKKKILSVRGMLHPGALAQKKAKKKLFLQLMKLSGIAKKITFHATDETEAGFVKDIFGRYARVEVAANFGRLINPSPMPSKEIGSLKLITIALISPMKNHLLVLQALGACRLKIEYNIYGPVKDMEYWQSCLREIKILPENIRVTYHGETAPENIPALLAQHHSFIMPSKSENFGHAIYEALSSGRPVITSHYTPWNELKENNAGINVNTDPADIAAAIEIFAAADELSLKKSGKDAAVYAAGKMDQEKIIAAYRHLFSVQ